jgi:hypothetical protein
MDDGGWGQIAAGLADAIAPDPYKRAKMMMAGASYRKTELETEELRRKMQAAEESIRGFPSTIKPNAELPAIGGQEEFGPVRPEVQQAYRTNREQRIRDNAYASLLAKNAEDFAKGVYGTRAMGEVSGGIPSDPGRQDVLQTLLSGSGASLPNYSATPHTYQPLDAAGQPQGPAVTSRRVPDAAAALVGPAKLGEVDNPFENEPKMLNFLSNLQRRIDMGGDITPKEAQTVEVDTSSGRPVERQIRKTAISAGFGRVAQLADDYRERFGPGATGDRTVLSPPVVVPPPPAPPAAAGGLVGSPTPVTAPPVAPIVPPPAAAPAGAAGLRLGSGPNVQTGAPTGPINPIEFGQRAKQDKLTYEYETVQQNWESMVKNLQIDSKAADIGLIFAAAKVLDPPSVVRGQEGETLRRTGGWGDQAVGFLNQIQGGTALTKEQRADLAHMVENRAKATEAVYFEQRGRWAQQGQAGGLSPEQVEQHLPTATRLTPFDIDSVNRRPGVQTSGSVDQWRRNNPTTAPASAPAARAPGRTIRVNPDGSIVDVP